MAAVPKEAHPYIKRMRQLGYTKDEVAEVFNISTKRVQQITNGYTQQRTERGWRMVAGQQELPFSEGA